MADADAAVAIVHAHGDTDSVLVMRRTERATDPWSGHWSFPGGRREPHDSGLVRTALRELREECGIQLSRDNLEAALPISTARRRTGRYLLVAPFVFGVDQELPVVLDAEEAVESVWAPVSLLRDAAHHALLPVPGLPPGTRFPAIDLLDARKTPRGDVPLWGFTYRLITDWLQLNPPENFWRAASFEAAQAWLDWIAARGCARVHDWIDRDVAKVATVEGTLPVEAILERAATPAAQIPRINMLEAQADRLRIVGLKFEEYLILSSGANLR